MDFDAHAHLPKAGPERVPEHWRGVICASSEAEFEPLRRLANLRPGVIPAFGIHPWFVRERSPAWLESLRRVLDTTPRAQIGEIGLDKARANEVSLDEQEAVFIPQLRLAAEKSVPATIHCVRAWHALLAILRAEKSLPRLHFHAFSGSAEIAKTLLQLSDATFSFSPRQRANGGAKPERALAAIPPNRIFPESDSDFSD